MKIFFLSKIYQIPSTTDHCKFFKNLQLALVGECVLVEVTGEFMGLLLEPIDWYDIVLVLIAGRGGIAVVVKSKQVVGGESMS